MTMLRVLPQRKGFYKWKLLWNLVSNIKIYFNYYFWKLPYHSYWMTAASPLSRILLFRGSLHLPTNTTWPFTLDREGKQAIRDFRRHEWGNAKCQRGAAFQDITECENKKGHGRWPREGEDWRRSWRSHTSRQQEEEVRQEWSKGSLMVEQEWINVLWRANTASTVQ